MVSIASLCPAHTLTHGKHGINCAEVWIELNPCDMSIQDSHMTVLPAY